MRYFNYLNCYHTDSFIKYYSVILGQIKYFEGVVYFPVWYLNIQPEHFTAIAFLSKISGHLVYSNVR